jgi:CRP-like cAMP-binding protein
MQLTLSATTHSPLSKGISPHRALLLTQSDLLKDIAPEQTDQLLNTARIIQYKTRSSRIDSDDLKRKIHFVLSGEMHIIKPTPDGQECLLRRIGPSEFFCLSSLLSAHSCTNHSVAASPTETLCWPRDQFEKFMQNSPTIYLNLTNLMANHVEQERQMRTLSHCCRADIKVAAYLLHRARLSGPLPTTINLRPIGVTAQEIGIARETLSRTVHRLSDLGLINYRQGLVYLIEPQTLEGYLEQADQLCHCTLNKGPCRD